tara:strand:- start:238 stop:567 length:330 start_codon:yes stop_codon:yes gene_type:complete
MDGYRIIWGYLEKLSLGVWGLNIIDLLAISEIGFLKDLDSSVSAYLGVIGAVYLTVQIPFKVLELISKREHNRLVNELKQEDLKDKRNNKKKLSSIKDKFEVFDQVHEK